jgi:hypothetical protein
MRATRNTLTILPYLLILIPFGEIDILSSSMQFPHFAVTSFLLRQSVLSTFFQSLKICVLPLGGEPRFTPVQKNK